MAIVGVAHAPEPYLVIVNSWGERTHSGGRGFLMLEMTPGVLKLLKARITAVDFDEAHEKFRPMKKRWDAMATADRKRWLSTTIGFHNEFIEHIPCIRLAQP